MLTSQDQTTCAVALPPTGFQDRTRGFGPQATSRTGPVVLLTIKSPQPLPVKISSCPCFSRVARRVCMGLVVSLVGLAPVSLNDTSKVTRMCDVVLLSAEGTASMWKACVRKSGPDMSRPAYLSTPELTAWSDDAGKNAPGRGMVGLLRGRRIISKP